jgi:hypothetical protein
MFGHTWGGSGAGANMDGRRNDGRLPAAQEHFVATDRAIAMIKAFIARHVRAQQPVG